MQTRPLCHPLAIQSDPPLVGRANLLPRPTSSFYPRPFVPLRLPTPTITFASLPSISALPPSLPFLRPFVSLTPLFPFQALQPWSVQPGARSLTLSEFPCTLPCLRRKRVYRFIRPPFVGQITFLRRKMLSRDLSSFGECKSMGG